MTNDCRQGHRLVRVPIPGTRRPADAWVLCHYCKGEGCKP